MLEDGDFLARNGKKSAKMTDAPGSPLEKREDCRYFIRNSGKRGDPLFSRQARSGDTR